MDCGYQHDISVAEYLHVVLDNAHHDLRRVFIHGGRLLDYNSGSNQEPPLVGSDSSYLNQIT